MEQFPTGHTNNESEKHEKLLNRKSQEETNLKVQEIITQENTEEQDRYNKTTEKTLNDIESQSRLLLNTLHERKENRFTQFLDNAQFSGLVVNLKILNAVKIPSDTESAVRAIKTIGIIMHEMKMRPNSSQVRENPESLQKLAFAIKQLQVKVDDLQNSLIKSNFDEIKELRDATKMTRDSLEQSRGYVLRLLNNLPH